MHQSWYSSQVNTIRPADSQAVGRLHMPAVLSCWLALAYLRMLLQLLCTPTIASLQQAVTHVPQNVQVVTCHAHAAVDAAGLTPLMRAVALGKLEIIQALLEAGADPWVGGVAQETPPFNEPSSIVG